MVGKLGGKAKYGLVLVEMAMGVEEGGVVVELVGMGEGSGDDCREGREGSGMGRSSCCRARDRSWGVIGVVGSLESFVGEKGLGGVSFCRGGGKKGLGWITKGLVVVTKGIVVRGIHCLACGSVWTMMDEFLLLDENGI